MPGDVSCKTRPMQAAKPWLHASVVALGVTITSCGESGSDSTVNPAEQSQTSPSNSTTTGPGPGPTPIDAPAPSSGTLPSSTGGGEITSVVQPEGSQQTPSQTPDGTAPNANGNTPTTTPQPDSANPADPDDTSGDATAAPSMQDGGVGDTASGEPGAAEDGGNGEISGPISDLMVEANPNSVLSAFVSWTTSEPATSVVQFGVGGLTFQTEDSSLTTEHRVLVIGMRAESTYDIRAISVGASTTVQGDSTFTTASLPDQIPVAMVNLLDASKMQPGWTLMNVQKGNGTERALSGAPPAAVVYDEEGHPVWYYIHGDQTERGGAISVDMTDVGVIIGPADTSAPAEVDWAGNVVWTCSNVTCGSGGPLSHHAHKLSNGNYIIQRDAPIGGRTSQIFEELTSSNELVHSIGVEDLVTPPGGASGDWAHGNAITVDLDNDVAYLSFRWLGVMKAVYSERRLLWHLPASYGAQGMGDMTFVPPESQFTDIHDPEIYDDGTMLIFDNGGFTGQVSEGNPGGLQTRIVQYAIDETAKTATLVWEFPGNFDVDPWYTEQFYVPFWGDADTLENGNVLVTAGRRGVQPATPESRVFEVAKADGEVVWELMLPQDYGIYRADRVSLPLVRRIDAP